MQPYFPLIAALVGALVAGFVNSLFKFYELRFQQNAIRREKQYNLWGEIADVIRMLDMPDFKGLWQSELIRNNFMNQIVAVKKAYQKSSGHILSETMDVYEYIFHKLSRKFVLNTKIHVLPASFDLDVAHFLMI